jgi:8-oxo-dGTP diphosphatase
MGSGRIEAAGGVVVDLSKGKAHYLIVHRPAYDDWTLPKGKRLPDEKSQDAALREVKEETGLVCELVAKLGTVEYVTPNGNQKRVKYYLMRAISGSFVPNDEVDIVTWAKRSQALTLLTHPLDQRILIDAHIALADLHEGRQQSLADNAPNPPLFTF